MRVILGYPWDSDMKLLSVKAALNLLWLFLKCLLSNIVTFLPFKNVYIRVRLLQTEVKTKMFF